jgi:hypothetical protein
MNPLQRSAWLLNSSVNAERALRAALLSHFGSGTTEYLYTDVLTY